MLKTFGVIFVIAATLGLLQTWWTTFVVGHYYLNAGLFLTILGGLAPIVLVVGAAFLIGQIVRFDKGIDQMRALSLAMVVCLTITSSACSRGGANVQTLISDDCGVSWTLIPPGQVIPSRIGPCAYKVSIPDYPMQGETRFKTSFANRVLADVEIAYEYSIFDGKVFIGEAKYLGRANSAVDDSTNSSAQYESAENAVIDKRIRDVATEMLLKEDIVEFSQSEFEDKLLEAVNERLKDKGVRLNFLSFVPTPEEQTRLAIDMMTAMKVYESKGLGELGKAVATARAGATHIEMNSSCEKQ